MNSQTSHVLEEKIKKTFRLFLISAIGLGIVAVVLVASVFFTYIPVVNTALVFALVFSMSCALMTNKLNKLSDEHESLVSLS